MIQKKDWEHEAKVLRETTPSSSTSDTLSVVDVGKVASVESTVGCADLVVWLLKTRPSAGIVLMIIAWNLQL